MIEYKWQKKNNKKKTASLVACFPLSGSSTLKLSRHFAKDKER